MRPFSAATADIREINSADEILEAVREVEAISRARSGDVEAQYDAEALWSRWRQQLSVPYYYGASRPSLYYLRKHEATFLADPQNGA